MSRAYIMSDLHLGHKNIHKFRDQFSSAEEHHEVVYDNLCSTITKRDVVYFLGDVAFDKHWLGKIKELQCVKKILVVGNHDIEHGISMKDVCETYDAVYGLYNKNKHWLSHAPIHPDEIRQKVGICHGHTHSHLIDDDRYVNVCCEYIDYKPYLFTRDSIRELKEKQIEIRARERRMKLAMLSYNIGFKL